MLLIFKIQPKIEPHVQNFEISKFELFALKIQKCSILFYWNLGHYLGPKIQQIDHWAQNLCQNPDHHSVHQILQLDACRWFEQQNATCSKFPILTKQSFVPFKSPKNQQIFGKAPSALFKRDMAQLVCSFLGRSRGSRILGLSPRILDWENVNQTSSLFHKQF